MKHKILFVLLIACTSVSAQISKGALISVFGDRNLSDDPLDTKVFEKLMKDTAFNLNPIVNRFDKAVREKLLPQFPFPFLSKEEVVGAAGYPALAELTRFAKDSWMTTAADQYVPIAAYGIADDTKAIVKAFDVVQNGVDGVMICYVSFNIVDGGGFGPLAKKKINSYVNIKIFDKTGKRIFKLKEKATSDEGVLAVGGIITDFGKLKPMIESSFNNLLKDMDAKLPKSLAKMAKQMDKYNKD